MMKIRRFFAAAGLVVALSALPGCIVVAGNGKRSYQTDGKTRIVTNNEMRSLVAANKQAFLGMRQEDALALYPAELLTMMTVAQAHDAPLEVWQVHATSSTGATTFTRWLYFYDGELRLLSDKRLDLDGDAGILASWQRD